MVKNKKLETSTRNSSIENEQTWNNQTHTYERAHQRVYCFPAVIIHGPEKEIIMLELCVSVFFVFNSI